MSDAAIDFYNEIVAATPDSSLREISAKFLSDLLAQKASYGERPLSTFLRPKFITPDDLKKIESICLTLRECVIKIKDAIAADPKFLEQVGLSEGERRLCDIDPGFTRLSITARWDAFMTKDSLKFVELNAESPAGIGYGDVMSDLYLGLPFMKKFNERYKLQPFATRTFLLRHLLETYRDWKGIRPKRTVPNLAIVDWREVPTWNEFELLQEYFISQGVATIVSDPRDLTYDGAALRRGDFEIDLVYKRILTNEFVERPDEVQPIVKAYQDHRICLINSFRAKLVHKKSLFAILTHEKNKSLFNASEHEVIRQHIPWTRRVEKTKPKYKGKSIDLLDFITKHKDELVIKPNDEYGGSGVTLGWDTPADKWEQVISNALNDFYVVQERVPIPREKFPYYQDGLRFADLIVDLDPYVFGPEIGGVLTRLSAGALANVTAGGGATSTFVLTER
jgi:hypothetical protein